MMADDPDVLVACTCEHRKDDHCNGVEYCKRTGCRCDGFTFRSPEDRARWQTADRSEGQNMKEVEGDDRPSR